MGFRFRQFTVEDSVSTQRIGTDAMLLGAWASPDTSFSRILDVGTGCGVIALMLAQKCPAAFIDAIDIDQPSIRQASSNFLNSPWAGRLRAIQTTFQEYFKLTDARYDYIVSNPPFFVNALKSPQIRRNQTRHDTMLNFHELVKGSAALLSSGGRLAVVIPVNGLPGFSEQCVAADLYPSRQTTISHKEGYPAVRVLAEYSRVKNISMVRSNMYLRTADDRFSEEYLKLTSEYHLFHS